MLFVVSFDYGAAPEGAAFLLKIVKNKNFNNYI